MNAPVLKSRLNMLLERRGKLNAEIQELRRLLEGKTQPMTKRSRYVIPACGTESGYQRHRHRGEDCDECRAAHADHNRMKARG